MAVPILTAATGTETRYLLSPLIYPPWPSYLLYSRNRDRNKLPALSSDLSSMAVPTYSRNRDRNQLPALSSDLSSMAVPTYSRNRDRNKLPALSCDLSSMAVPTYSRNRDRNNLHALSSDLSSMAVPTYSRNRERNKLSALSSDLSSMAVPTYYTAAAGTETSYLLFPLIYPPWFFSYRYECLVVAELGPSHMGPQEFSLNNQLI
jgi:hypothetical protein